MLETEILVNISPFETRVAVVENQQLLEVEFETTKTQGLLGNIYKAKVERVLAGLQVAFVNIGQEQNGFLPVSEVIQDSHEKSKTIEEILRPGQIIMVQIIKPSTDTKGAKISMNLALTSSYLVYMPFETMRSVSKKIIDKTDRKRLKTILKDIALKGGLIARTLAGGVSINKLNNDISYLQKLWQSVQESKQELIYKELPLHLKILRDANAENVNKIYLDCDDYFKEMQQFITDFVPTLSNKLQLKTNKKSLFEQYNINSKIEQALNPQVTLSCGGSLIIEETQSMTTIDVNTGSFVGIQDLEKTIYQTNLEAIKVIAQQLRLRKLSGIIIIDLINMKKQSNNKIMITTLKEALIMDKVTTTVGKVSPLGLLEMTRHGNQLTLRQELCNKCAICDGNGYTKSLATIFLEMFRELLNLSNLFNNKLSSKFLEIKILASVIAVEYFNNEKQVEILNLQEDLQINLKFKSMPSYSVEQYDIVVAQ